MLPFEGGTPLTIADILAALDAARADGIEGVTLLGGEPLAQPAGAAVLLRAAHDLCLTTMVFTGYTLAEVKQLSDPAVTNVLSETDILVDGPYLRELPERRRRWIGSANQQVHFLSGRCDANDPRWLLPNTLELRLRGGELTVNGFPARQAAPLWKRLSLRR
jgi:anaerobic ribonucleoside-triphosphate reductase activating protein